MPVKEIILGKCKRRYVQCFSPLMYKCIGFIGDNNRKMKIGLIRKITYNIFNIGTRTGSEQCNISRHKRMKYCSK